MYVRVTFSEAAHTCDALHATNAVNTSHVPRQLAASHAKSTQHCQTLFILVFAIREYECGDANN